MIYIYTTLYITCTTTIIHLHAKHWFWDLEHVEKNEINLMQISVPSAQVLPHPQQNFPSKFRVFGIFLDFQWQKSLKINISHILNPNLIPKKIIKSRSSRLPRTPKARSTSSEIFSYYLIYFSVKKSFNIQELLHRESKHHGIKPVHPSSLTAFQRHQEQSLKHPGSLDLIRTNKTNKQLSFIQRWYLKTSQTWA
jgi:hypothetical protein